MNFKENTNTLNKIPIQDIASWLGIVLPQKGSIRCPFPDHEDKNPSFEIKTSGTRWICYGCNRKGGSIDFVKEYNKMDFLAAKQWLESRTHHDIGGASTSRKVSKKKKEKSEKADHGHDREHTNVYDLLLKLCPLRESGNNYLLSRGVTPKTMSIFKVAQMPPHQNILSKLLGEFGYECVNAAGLLTKKSTIDSPRIIFPWNAVIFPFLESGRVVYLQARALEGEEKYGKWRNLNFQPRRIYNVDAITQNSKLPFAICEGVIDTLSAIELGYNAIGIMGVTASLTPDQIRALRKKEVEILLDWDKPGEERAQSLQEELNQYGVVSIRKKLPSKTATDLNEYLKEKRELT